MKHKHAELMMEYAKDAMETNKPWDRWEVAFEGGLFEQCEHHPSWAVNCEYRRKPRTIMINGIEVPEPYRGEMRMDQEYWYVVASSQDLACRTSWGNLNYEKSWQDRGLIHLTKESAIKHAEALLSFTKLP